MEGKVSFSKSASLIDASGSITTVPVNNDDSFFDTEQFLPDEQSLELQEAFLELQMSSSLDLQDASGSLDIQEGFHDAVNDSSWA